MKKNLTGFTYIELVVVVAIIGILSIAAVLSFQNSQKNGRDRQRMSDLAKLAAALETYRARNGFYPSENAAPAGCDSSTGLAGAQTCVNGYTWGGGTTTDGSDINDLVTTNIIKALPRDPVNAIRKVGANDTIFTYHVELDKVSAVPPNPPAGQGTPKCLNGPLNSSCRYLMQTLLENGPLTAGGNGVCIYYIIGGGGTPEGWNAGTCRGSSVTPLGWVSIPCCKQ